MCSNSNHLDCPGCRTYSASHYEEKRCSHPSMVQAKAQARQQAKEGDRLGKAVEARDSRIAVLVQEKQRLSEEADQRLSQVDSQSRDPVT